MTNQFVSQWSEEELRLVIGDALAKNDQLTVTDFVDKIFGTDIYNLSSVIEDFATDECLRQLKNLCRFLSKHWIGNSLKDGSSDFIRTFVKAEKEDRLREIFSDDVRHRLLVLEEKDAMGSLLTECSRLFHRLRQKYAPAQSEDRFRNFLAQWLQSGFVPLSTWQVFHQWKLNGPTLANLKILRWPEDARNDSNWRELQRLMKSIKSDNFIEVEKLQTLLDLLLATPNLSIQNGTVKITGRTIYLSEYGKTISNTQCKTIMRPKPLFMLKIV